MVLRFLQHIAKLLSKCLDPFIIPPSLDRKDGIIIIEIRNNGTANSDGNIDLEIFQVLHSVI